MGRKHYRARSRIRDAMRLWNRSARVLWWATLTSSPQSPRGRLRADFQAWRKRLARQLSIDPADIQYAMVDTREGHGVLHLVLSLPRGVGEWLDYRVIGEWWREIHGARQVKFLRVKSGDGSVRRLSQYIVSQYMVSQGEVEDLLGRISTTRFELPLSKLRERLRGLITARWRAYQWAHDAMGGLEGSRDPEAVTGLLGDLRRMQWKVFRDQWAHLLDKGWCWVWGDKWLIEGGALCEL
jgi:hypothetical protein